MGVSVESEACSGDDTLSFDDIRHSRSPWINNIDPGY